MQLLPPPDTLYQFCLYFVKVGNSLWVLSRGDPVQLILRVRLQDQQLTPCDREQRGWAMSSSMEPDLFLQYTSPPLLAFALWFGNCCLLPMWQVDTGLIPQASLDDQTSELQGLGLSVFNQDEFEQGVCLHTQCVCPCDCSSVHACNDVYIHLCVCVITVEVTFHHLHIHV